MKHYYEQLLKIEYKTPILLICIICIFALVIILSFLLETYDVYTNNAIYNDYLLISVPIENSDAVINGEYVIINNKKYTYKVMEISELKVNSYQNYQDYKLWINTEFKQNEVLKITFYYDKEKIYKKIVDVIF